MRASLAWPGTSAAPAQRLRKPRHREAESPTHGHTGRGMSWDPDSDPVPHRATESVAGLTPATRPPLTGWNVISRFQGARGSRLAPARGSAPRFPGAVWGLAWPATLPCAPCAQWGTGQGPGCCGPGGRCRPEARCLQASVWLRASGAGLWPCRSAYFSCPFSTFCPRWALSREGAGETTPGFSRFSLVPQW